jgi:FMN-dependent NADH-azoreductase
MPMKTLLKIQTSLSGSKGDSSQLADHVVDRWLQQNPGGRVIVRDLSTQPVPHLTAERFAAFASKADTRTPEQQSVLDYSDALIAELESADLIVLAVPMHNFSVPSTLRAYFDHIARAGVTFKYTSDGPQGLLLDKKAHIVITRGGIIAEAADTQTAYLKQFLAFLGVSDVQVTHAEGLAYGDEARERSLNIARHTLEKTNGATALAA